MAPALTDAALAPVLSDRPFVVEGALRAIYSDARQVRDIGVLREAAGDDPLAWAGALRGLLEQDAKTGEFVSILLRHGIDLEGIGAPETPAMGWDHDGVARFAMASRGFRCRIRVDGATRGSGILISPRLVLTAQHVVDGAGAGTIDIVASDGQAHPARLAFAMPFNPVEETGAMPPASAALTECDIALLRLDRPLGHLYGRATLPDPPVDVNGRIDFALVHFPDGQDRGLQFDETWRNAPGDLRLVHEAASHKGSSGGAGFDTAFRFIGVHQGAWGDRKRLVPHDQFGSNAEFRAQIEADGIPNYLWSLDNTLDSHLVIGRTLFFDAVTAVVEGSAPRLRGVWVRRAVNAQNAGLSFTYRMLQAHLGALAAPDTCLRVAPATASDDLIALLQGAAFGTGATADRAGVRRGETTRVASDADRALALADALQDRAATEKRPVWIYFDSPLEEVSQEVQHQLEQLVGAILARPDLRLVLAGYETYDLPGALVQSVPDARAASGTCMMREILGQFTRDDVIHTLEAMSRTLGFGWAPAVVQHIAKRALHGLTAQGGRFRAEDLGAVAAKMLDEARMEISP